MNRYDYSTDDSRWMRRIDTLRREAGEAGDLAQVALCDRALAGSARARQACIRVLVNARAQADAQGDAS